MRAGGGKAKGSSFERDVCKALSLWVSHGKREDLFWRSAMSGGRATVGRRKGKDLAQHAGDISATHVLGHALTDYWYVECKRYADLKIESALLEGVGTLAGFWRETCKQATDHKKMPMLIARQDRSPTIMLTPVSWMQNPYGVDPFGSVSKIARMHILSADVHLFDVLVKREFPEQESHSRFRFLKPGEFDRIMAQGKKKPAATRERIKIKRERVRIR
jgi:hypothetical protein